MPRRCCGNGFVPAAWDVSATYYARRGRFGSLEGPLRRLRVLEKENTCLKRLLPGKMLGTSISARWMMRELGDLIVERDTFGMIVSDNGTERHRTAPNVVLCRRRDTISRQAGRRRTGSSCASIAERRTNCSTRRCSSRSATTPSRRAASQQLISSSTAANARDRRRSIDNGLPHPCPSLPSQRRESYQCARMKPFHSRRPEPL